MTSIEFEKALAVWFTSVWGIMLVLLNREETRGPFTRLNTGQWKLLPVLDVTNLNQDSLSRLCIIFDRFHKSQFRNIHEQFSNNIKEVDKTRLMFDIEFLRALDPTIDETLVRGSLLSLYSRMRDTMETLIKST
jgi:hypothetical protein